MKKYLLLLSVLMLVSFTVSDNGLTESERLAAMAEMTTTHDHLLNNLKGLSEAQLNFKSSPDSWSIAECTEHITISEENIFGMIETALKTPADASRRSEVKMSDEQILSMTADRSTKVKTSEAFEPSGKYGSHEETLVAFKKKRKSNMQFVASTEEDLRNHYSETPFGIIDAYQVLLFMSAHTERHVLQIEEIKADPNFPK
tara:strand:- start:122695 stop:123297 length:603 start_codon:yes stop_codon:yes gene_type:complete